MAQNATISVYCNECDEEIGKVGFHASARQLAQCHECDDVEISR